MLIGLGGRLLNRMGEDFLSVYAETRAHQSTARRSSLGNASIRELEAGRGPILRDSHDLSPADIRLLDVVIPIIMRTFRSATIDIRDDLVPYTRALVGSTAVSGAGIRIEPDGRTSLPGLFAAGNTTDGAYVIMSQNLATCAVLGWWTGCAMRRRRRSTQSLQWYRSIKSGGLSPRWTDIWRAAATRHCGRCMVAWRTFSTASDT